MAATDGVFDNLFDHQVGSQGWNDVGMFPVDTSDPIGLSVLVDLKQWNSKVDVGFHSIWER